MNLQRFGLAVIILLAGFALFVAGTSGLAGNIANDVGFYTNPVAGLVFLAVFVIAVFLVLRGLAPES
jgi:hypothetical protein